MNKNKTAHRIQVMEMHRMVHGKRMKTVRKMSNRPSTQSLAINHRRKSTKPWPENGASHAKCPKRVDAWIAKATTSIVNMTRYVTFICLLHRLKLHFPFRLPFGIAERTSKDRWWLRSWHSNVYKWSDARIGLYNYLNQSDAFPAVAAKRKNKKSKNKFFDVFKYCGIDLLANEGTW